MTGTQFNGLSQAVAYGDDYQAATNYPLVRITNNVTGHVFYAHTHSHSTMAVATGNTPVSTEFDVPASIETGASKLVVVANGIPSQPVAVDVSTATATATSTSTPTATATATATSTVTATLTPTATPTPITVPVALKVAPSSINFGKVRVGRAKFIALTLSNPAKKGGPSITFGSPFATVPLANPQEFGFRQPVGTNCPAQLLPRRKCSLFMEFFPASSGQKFDQLTIFDNATNANQTVPLQGIGR